MSVCVPASRILWVVPCSSEWGLLMLKKLLIIVGVVGAAALIVKRVKESSDERALWHEATTAPDLR